MGGGVRLVCSTLGPAEGRNPSCTRVHSRPLLALGLDKPVLHPHPCKILLVYVAHLCIVHFYQLPEKESLFFLELYGDWNLKTHTNETSIFYRSTRTTRW